MLVQNYERLRSTVRHRRPTVDHRIADRWSPQNALSVSSIKKAKYVLDAAFKWALSTEKMTINPIEGVRTILNNKLDALENKNADDVDVKVLTIQEELCFLITAKEKKPYGQYKYPGGIHGRFLLKTGIRIGEYIALRWKDYDRENHILRVNKSRHPVKALEHEDVETSYISLEGSTKNKKARNIELSDDAISILDEIYSLTPWKGPDDYIALTKTGNNYTATEIEHIVGTVYKNAGISDNVSGLHILRRSFATKLYQEGYTIKDIAAYLGDEEATVAKYYIAAREVREVDGKRIAVVSLKK